MTSFNRTRFVVIAAIVIAVGAAVFAISYFMSGAQVATRAPFTPLKVAPLECPSLAEIQFNTDGQCFYEDSNGQIQERDDIEYTDCLNTYGDSTVDWQVCDVPGCGSYVFHGASGHAGGFHGNNCR